MDMKALTQNVTDGARWWDEIPDVCAFDGSRHDEHRLCGGFAIIAKAPVWPRGHDLIRTFLGTQSKVLERLPLCTPQQVGHTEHGATRVIQDHSKAFGSLGIVATVRRPLIEAERHDR